MITRLRVTEILHRKAIIRGLALLLVPFLVLFMLSVLDHAVGHLGSPLPEGLVLPPNSHFRYETPEFTFTTETNSLGFRDREVTDKRGLRVVSIGDSFTYGWGVEINQSWPKILEKELGVEVLNLGQPGGSPLSYAAITEKAVPLLKPDLIIIAVLQGDDLTQLSPPQRSPRKSRLPDPLPSLPARLLSRAYPTMLGYLRRRAVANLSLKDVWRKQAKEVLANLSDAEQERYNKMDGHVRELFNAGELNPALVRNALTRPDYLLVTMERNKPEIRVMSECLVRIKRAAEGGGAKAIVVSAPLGAYVSERDLAIRKRMGFSVSSEMLTSNTPDNAIKSASDLAGVEFYSVTEGFRYLAKERSLFYEYDGHLTNSGHQTYAELLKPIISKQLSQSLLPKFPR